MKVLILGSGKSFHATRWANSLVEKGIEVAFATVHKLERPLKKEVKFFQLSERGYKGYLLDVNNLKKVICDYKPDILHAHFSTGYGLLSKLSGFQNRIISIYGTDIYEFPTKSFFHKKLLEFNLKGCRKILSTSESMADEFLKHYPMFERPIVTPFGVDINKFRKFKKDKNLNEIKIGLVKKLEDKYGIHTLIRAFAIVNNQLNNVSLHIAGGGSKEKFLKNLTKELGIEDKVKFYGWISNDKVSEFLNNLDICVIPSESESFGVAAVEAQACEVPVIVSNVGGLPEVVKDNETGIVVPPKNPEILAENIKKLCLNEDLRLILGKNGRKRVEKLYNWDKNLDLMISIYKGVIDG